jgi:hypothetical protein
MTIRSAIACKIDLLEDNQIELYTVDQMETLIDVIARTEHA